MWLVCTGEIRGNLPMRLEPGHRYVVGRSKDAHIRLNDSALSRRHAELVCKGNSVIVSDLDSRNGTFVNEQPASKTVAEIGSRIRFGTVVCLLCATAILPAKSAEASSTFAVRSAGGADVMAKLTEAQTEVLEQLLRGREESRIARVLHRSRHTIHTHVKAIYRHFGVHSRLELIARLLLRGQEEP
ncbi:MAG: FHA domain-containing protein [Gammaproteobacteria bacterium]